MALMSVRRHRMEHTMAIGTTVLNKQKQAYLKGMLYGIVFIGFGMFGGVMILKDGIGKAPSRNSGLAADLHRFMTKTMAESELGRTLVPICFAGFFFILAAIGLYYFVRAARQMSSTRTMLGVSMLTQAQEDESFSAMLESIDADMDYEPHKFRDVYIGRKWILCQEAMRLSRIQGVFTLNAGKEDYVITCVDDANNVWAATLIFEDERDKAVKYLQKILPEAVFGTYDDYLVFLKEDISTRTKTAL